MQPPSLLCCVLAATTATLLLAPAPALAADGDIVDVAVKNGGFKTLVDFVTKAGLVATLQQNQGGVNWMVLAPTDTAFERLSKEQVDFVTGSTERLKGLLLSHVIVCGQGPNQKCPTSKDLFSGQIITTNGNDGGRPQVTTNISGGGVYFKSGPSTAKVVIADVPATNGIIHAIDTVLIPDCIPVTPGAQDLVQTLLSDCDNRFSTLATAVGKANLTSALQAASDAGLTVFAPTNAAFAKVPEADLNALLADAEELANVLTYHVATKKVMSDVLAHDQVIDTLNGNVLTVRKLNDEVAFVDNAGRIVSDVETADIEATNGVAHAIDTVLFPEDNIINALKKHKHFSTIVMLLEKFKLDAILSKYGPFTIFAPNNNALKDVDPDTMDEDTVIKILRYHVVPGLYKNHDLTDGQVLNTDAEETITLGVKTDGDGKHKPSDVSLTCNDAKKTTASVINHLPMSVNGLVYQIDSLLMPGDTTTTTMKPGAGKCNNEEDTKSIQKKGTFLQESLEDSMGQLLACKDGLFAGFFTGGDCALLDTGRDCANIQFGFPPRVSLDNACLTGKVGPIIAKQDGLTVGCAGCFAGIAGCSADKCQDTCADGLTLNIETKECRECVNSKCWSEAVKCAGVPEEILPSKGESDVTARRSILDILANGGPYGNNTFSTLVAALEAAGLDKTLDADVDGGYTLFAPTDEAFAEVPADTLAALLKDTAELKSVLLYHVAAGTVLAKDLSNGLAVKTLSENKVLSTQVLYTGEVAFVDNGGNIVADVDNADILASNGVVHMIDAVLFPKRTVANILEDRREFATLVSLLKLAGVFDGLQSAGPVTMVAPNNDAFEKVPTETVAMLQKPENKEMLLKILGYHLIDGLVREKDVFDGLILKTTVNEELTLSLDGETYALISNDEKKTTAGFASDAAHEGTNGLIWTIDTVLMPGTTPQPVSSEVDGCKSDADIQNLLYTSSTRLAPVLNRQTVPLFYTSESCSTCLTAYATCSAKCTGNWWNPNSGCRDPTSGGCAKCVSVDNTCWSDLVKCAGVPAYVFPAVPTFATENRVTGLSGKFGDIIASATSDPASFSALAGFLTTAKLIDALQGEGPFTVFAPSNAALDGVDAVPSDVLKQHVVAGTYTAAELVDMDGEKVTTLKGEELEIVANIFGVSVRDPLGNLIHVDRANIRASNGIIHRPLKDPAFSILRTALATPAGSDMAEKLFKTKMGTVFAPIDKAFEGLPAGALNCLLAAPDKLQKILEFHYELTEIWAPGTKGFVDGATVTTAGGEVLTARCRNKMTGCTGPAKSGDWTLIGAQTSASVIDVLPASNGVLHMIDTVLVPEGMTICGTQTTTDGVPTVPTIGELVERTPILSSLLVNLNAAELMDTLKDTSGPTYTVFAPTTNAFESLPANVAELAADDMKVLQTVLLSHVIPNAVIMSTDLNDYKGITIKTASGQAIRIKKGRTFQWEITNEAGTVVANLVTKIKGSDASGVDIKASNGVVHIIDEVLLPNMYVPTTTTTTAITTSTTTTTKTTISGTTTTVTTLTTTSTLTATNGSLTDTPKML
eukprot:gene14652-23842_t